VNPQTGGKSHIDGNSRYPQIGGEWHMENNGECEPVIGNALQPRKLSKGRAHHDHRAIIIISLLSAFLFIENAAPSLNNHHRSKGGLLHRR
jgi:hypothetical protein